MYSLVYTHAGCKATNIKILINLQATAVAVVLFFAAMLINGLDNGAGMLQNSQGYQNSGTFVLLQATLGVLSMQPLACLKMDVTTTIMTFGTTL